MPARATITAGERYNRLVILKEVKNTDGFRKVKCICDCGGTVVTRMANLKSGNTKSCGCQNHGPTATRNKTKGQALSPEYNAYRNMLKRCYEVNSPTYAKYGQTGVVVCQRWRVGTKYSSSKDKSSRQGFLNFMADLGPRPAPDYELDKDLKSRKLGLVKPRYCPKTCIWRLGALNKADTSRKRSRHLLTR